VLFARVGGQLVATDPELILVVPASRRTSASAASNLDAAGGLRMATSQTYARRVHAERCEDYQQQARKDRLAAEMRAFTNMHGRSARKNRGL